MEDNLNYKKMPVNFQTLGISALDELDGLKIKESEKISDFDLETVSDDEEGLEIDDVETGTGSLFVKRTGSESGPGNDGKNATFRETIMEVSCR
jgi:hypothetical protein